MNFTDEEKITREKILNVAKRLAMADGLYNLNVGDIVKEAKISEETFHKFFNNVEEIGVELYTTRFGVTDENVLIMPLREKIKFVTFELVKQLELASVKTCRKWLNENLKNPDVITNDTELMRKVLKSSIDSGELRSDTPEEKLASFFMSALYGMLVNWCMTDTKFEPLEEIDTFSDFMLNSLIPYVK